jgi:outer membrane protein
LIIDSNSSIVLKRQIEYTLSLIKFKMVINRGFLLLGGLLIMVCLYLGIYNYLNHPKIAYVRSQELVYNYKGTHEARLKFDTIKEQWKANEDTLKLDFNKEVKAFNDQFHRMDENTREENRKRLHVKELQIKEYAKAIAEKTQKEDEQMMQGVLNQINSFVEDYGKRNGYDMIIGTTGTGNLLFGNAVLDITDILLKELNENYKKGQ